MRTESNPRPAYVTAPPVRMLCPPNRLQPRMSTTASPLREASCTIEATAFASLARNKRIGSPYFKLRGQWCRLAAQRKEVAKILLEVNVQPKIELLQPGRVATVLELCGGDEGRRLPDQRCFLRAVGASSTTANFPAAAPSRARPRCSSRWD